MREGTDRRHRSFSDLILSFFKTKVQGDEVNCLKSQFATDLPPRLGRMAGEKPGAEEAALEVEVRWEFLRLLERH